MWAGHWKPQVSCCNHARTKKWGGISVVNKALTNLLPSTLHDQKVDLIGPGTIGPVPKKSQIRSADTQVFTSDTGKTSVKRII